MKNKFVILFFVLVLILGVWYVRVSNDFQDDSSLQESLEQSVSLDVPILVDTGEDGVYFVSTNAEPKVMFSGQQLSYQQVPLDATSVGLATSLQQDRFMYKVASEQFSAETLSLSLDVDGHKLQFDNPNVLDLRIERKPNERKVLLWTNKDISSDFAKYIKVEPSEKLIFTKVEKSPGLIEVGMRNVKNIPYRLTLGKGVFSDYSQSKSLVLGPFNVNNVRYDFKKLIHINDIKNELNYYVQNAAAMNLRLYKFASFQEFYNAYVSLQSGKIRELLETYNLKEVRNVSLNYDRRNSKIDFSELTEDGFYLIRNKDAYGFVQRADFDFYFSRSQDAMNYMVYDLERSDFRNFNLDFFGTTKSSKNKVVSHDFTSEVQIDPHMQALYQFDVDGRKFLLSDYISFGKDYDDFYSHLFLDKPKYKFGERVKGNIFVGNFQKDLGNNNLVMRVTERFPSKHSLHDVGLVDEQELNLNSFGATDFVFDIPKALSSRRMNLNVNFYWKDQLLRSHYLQLTNEDKAQSLISGNFDKSFYVLGDKLNLSLQTALYNGEAKPNTEFQVRSMSNFNRDERGKVFSTNATGKFTKEFDLNTSPALYRNMYSPIHSVNAWFEVMDSKGENTSKSLRAPYYVSLLKLNYPSDLRFDSNNFDLKFKANELIPGKIENIGAPIENKEFQVKVFVDGEYLPEYNEVSEPVSLIVPKGDSLEDLMSEEADMPIYELSDAEIPFNVAQEIRINSNAKSLKRIGPIRLSNRLIYDKRIKTDGNGEFKTQIQIFDDPDILQKFKYLSLHIEVGFEEDGLNKSYKNTYRYQTDKFDDHRQYYNSLELVSLNGKAVEQGGKSINYKLGDKLVYRVKGFNSKSKYFLLQKDAGGLRVKALNSASFGLDVTKSYLPHFKVAVLEVRQDHEMVAHDGPNLRYKNSFEIVNKNPEKTFEPGQEYAMDLELGKKAFDGVVNVKLVDKKLYNNAFGEENVYQSLFSHNAHMSFGDFNGRRNDYGGKGGCFLPDSKILMADKTRKNIQDIQIGDEVLTFNAKAIGSYKKAVVQAVQDYMVNSYMLINGELKVTPNHQVYLNGEFQAIAHASVGDKLVFNSAERLVESIQYFDLDQPVKVYNFTVSPYHTYIVDGYFVHNEGKGAEAIMTDDLKSKVRENFQDVAFFETFYMNQQGSLLRSFILPDDMTTYKLLVSAFNKSQYSTGVLEDEIKITKDLIVEPLFPSVVNASDKIDLEYGVYGKEAANLQKSFVRLNDDQVDIQEPGALNKFNFDFANPGRLDYLLAAESESASDYYKDQIRVIDNKPKVLGDWKPLKKLPKNKMAKVLVQDAFRNFVYWQAKDLYQQMLTQDSLSSIEADFATQILDNTIANNGKNKDFEAFVVEIFDEISSNFETAIQAPALERVALTEDAIYSLAFLKDLEKEFGPIYKTLFLKDVSAVSDSYKMVYYMLASANGVYYFDEIESLQGQPYYFWAKAYMLYNYNQEASTFRFKHQLNGNARILFANNGELVLSVYDPQNFKYDLEGQNLYLYFANYQDLPVKKFKAIDKQLSRVENDVYRVNYDFSDQAAEIFNSKSSYVLSDTLPTGFELLVSEPGVAYDRCREYVYVNGRDLTVYLRKYYFEKNVRKNCELKFDYRMRASFSGDLLVPGAVLRSNLSKYYAKPQRAVVE